MTFVRHLCVSLLLTGLLAGTLVASNAAVAAPLQGKAPPAVAAAPAGEKIFRNAVGWQGVLSAANMNPNLGSQSYAATPQLNATVVCPEATQSWISDQLLIPFGVGLRGPSTNAQSCQINLKATSPAIRQSGAIRLGDGRHVASGQEANAIILNMGARAGVGFDCQACQDASGFNYDFAYQVEDGPGMLFDGESSRAVPNTVNSFEATHNQVSGAQNRAAGGVGMMFGTLIYPADINANDVLCYSGHCFADFAEFKQEIVASSFNWTMEDNAARSADSSTGLWYNGDANVVLVGATTNNIGTAVRLSPDARKPGAFNAFVTGLYAIDAARSIDNSSGFCGPAKTVTDIRVSLFACGQTGYLDFTTLDFSGGKVINASYIAPRILTSLSAPARFGAENAATINLVQMVPAAGASGDHNRDYIQMLDQSAHGGYEFILGGDDGDTLTFASISGGAHTARFRMDGAGNLAILKGTLTAAAIGADAGHGTASVCEDTATHVFYSGSATAGACAGAGSSARFTTDIRPLAGGLAQVEQLSPKQFRYRHGYGDNGARPQYGLLAEDVAKVLPDLVGKDAAKRPSSVDYVGLVPILVKALQQQQAEIAALQKRVADISRQARLTRRAGIARASSRERPGG